MPVGYCGHALALSPTSTWPKSVSLLCSQSSKVASCQTAALVLRCVISMLFFFFNLLGTWQRGMAAQKQNGVKDSACQQFSPKNNWQFILI